MMGQLLSVAAGISHQLLSVAACACESEWDFDPFSYRQHRFRPRARKQHLAATGFRALTTNRKAGRYPDLWAGAAAWLAFRNI